MAPPRVVRIDDRLHPQLRRARPLAQTRVDEPGTGAGRPRYGDVQVQAVPARSALTDFTMGGNVSGLAWSLNPYTGCMHRCTYCYVPDTMKVERGRWGRYVLRKEGLENVLARELRRLPRKTVYLSTGTDPYQPVEQEHRQTRACLELLLKHDWPVEILTRSPLVLRDLDLLTEFSQVRVGLSVPTLDDRARAAVEPHAPPIDARLETLHALSEAGLQTFANYTPAYPFTGGFTPQDLVDTFAMVGVQWMNTTPWRRMETVLPALRARLDGTEWEEMLARVRDTDRQRGLQRALERAAARAGLEVQHGFFNPPFGTRRGWSPSAHDRPGPVADARSTPSPPR